MNADLLAIGEQLRTQDNRIMQNPMFCVQEKRRFIGIDTAYAENFCWVNVDGEQIVFDDGKDFEEPETDDWDRFGYVNQWFTVMVAFTEAGCQEYLRLNGHNLKEPRIYVESFNRCPEMITIREALMFGTDVERQRDLILKALRGVLASAFPHPMENGVMYEAWEEAKKAIAEISMTGLKPEATK